MAMLYALGMPLDPSLASEAYCYLTTTGRVTGKPHEIEIWFGLAGETLYMLSGGRDQSDWVRNIRKQPAVTMRIAGQTLSGSARMLAEGDEDAMARRLLVDKYKSSSSGDLGTWGRASLPVAIDLDLS